MNGLIKIIFTASLLFNVVALSVVGVYWGRSFDTPDAMEELEPQARKEFREKMINSRQEMRPALKEMKNKTERLHPVIIQKNFDKEAYKKAVNDVLDTRDSLARKRADKMGETLQGLSVQEREKLSKHLTRSLSMDKMKRRRGARKSSDSEREKDFRPSQR